MSEYVYFKYGGGEILRVVASSLLEADEELRKATGIVAEKSPHIGCTWDANKK